MPGAAKESEFVVGASVAEGDEEEETVFVLLSSGRLVGLSPEAVVQARKEGKVACVLQQPIALLYSSNFPTGL